MKKLRETAIGYGVSEARVLAAATLTSKKRTIDDILSEPTGEEEFMLDILEVEEESND